MSLRSELEEACASYRPPKCDNALCRLTLKVEENLHRGSYQVSWRHQCGGVDRGGVLKERAVKRMKEAIYQLSLREHTLIAETAHA